VDFYLATDGDAFQFRPDLHPNGWRELEGRVSEPTLPQRRIAPLHHHLPRPGARDHRRGDGESLAGPSGIKFRKCPRLELHVYNLRHIQHHTGQLSAFLRRSIRRSIRNGFHTHGSSRQ
jgi:hypothetical protein